MGPSWCEGDEKPVDNSDRGVLVRPWRLLMFRCHLLLFALALCVVSACEEPPACDRLVSRLCAAAGPVACDALKERSPTDEASCAATLEDPAGLQAQLDALVAATAARALSAEKKSD